MLEIKDTMVQVHLEEARRGSPLVYEYDREDLEEPGGEDLGPIDELPVGPTHFGLDVPEDVPFGRGEHDRLPIFMIAQSGDEFSDALRGGGRAVVGSPREGRDGTCEHRALNCEEFVESRKN